MCDYCKKLENSLVESIYILIKNITGSRKILTSKGVGALAELTTELANKLKEEESCGEQESQECL